MKFKFIQSRAIACLLVLAATAALFGCGMNSVSSSEIEAIKPGNKIVYRFRRDGQTWYYADKVTRVEGDTIYYNPSKNESTSPGDGRLNEYDITRELSITKADILKFKDDQPPDEKRIYWIE